MRNFQSTDSKGKIIIGLAGMSTSGKSTVAHKLLKEFPKADYISTDDLYCTSQIPVISFYGKTIQNWEEPEGIMWNQILLRINKTNKEIIFVDSFILFSCKELVNILSGAVILEYQENEMLIATRRRIERVFGPVDKLDFSENNVFSSNKHFLTIYFRDLVWKPSWNEKKWMWDGSQAKCPILRLSATGNMTTNFARAHEFVLSIISSGKSK